MPATALPDKDLSFISCDLAELEADGTVPAVIVVVVMVIFAGVLEVVVLAEVESVFRVEIDEGACEIWSASASSTCEIMILTYRL